LEIDMGTQKDWQVCETFRRLLDPFSKPITSPGYQEEVLFLENKTQSFELPAGTTWVRKTVEPYSSTNSISKLFRVPSESYAIKEIHYKNPMHSPFQNHQVKVNAGQYVPCRVKYSEAMLQNLASAVGSKALSAEDRIGVLLDTFDL
jgi:hypothetical protein